MSIPFLLDEKPTVVRGCCGESGREAREISFIQLLARTQSDQHRRLALASGFRLLRSFGLDRLDAPGHAARRGIAGPDGWRILTITGGSSAKSARRYQDVDYRDRI